MNTCPSPRRIARGHSTDPLTLVAHLVDGSTFGAADAGAGPAGDDAAPSAAADPHLLFGAQFVPDGIDLHLSPIEGHPTDELLGFEAPADWSCLGVSCGAWASTYDGARRPAMTGVDRRHVHLVYAVDRAGASVTVYREGDGHPSTRRHTRATPETAGAIDDCLRRALGIPTAEAGSTLEYFAMRWVDDLFGRAVDGCLNGASWSEVAGRHDALLPTEVADNTRLRRWGLEHLVRAGEILADAKPWSAVLAATIEHHEQLAPGDCDLSLEALQWMDDGMFSRTMMGRYPPLEDLLLDLRDLLEPDVHARVVDTVERWGLVP